MKSFYIFIYLIFNFSFLVASTTQNSDIDKLYEDIELLNNEYRACIESLTEVEGLSSTKKIRLLQAEIDNLKYELSREKIKNQKLEVLVEDKNFKLDSSDMSYFPATTYKTLHDVDVYDAIDGKVIEHWNKNQPFTSTQKSRYWIKVSGYFNPNYKTALKDLWIKRDSVKLHEREKE